jgi:proteasome-associated ATPase
VDTKAGYAFERIPKAEVEDLVLEEVPDVSYADVGGLDEQIEQIFSAAKYADLQNFAFRYVCYLLWLKEFNIEKFD